ncbi:hypothetical protein KI387_040585, partial [Taxus chinensis]
MDTRGLENDDDEALDSTGVQQDSETFPSETIIALSSTLRYKAFRVRGVLQGQRVAVG